jgi:hypothetical protein
MRPARPVSGMVTAVPLIETKSWVVGQFEAVVKGHDFSRAAKANE